MSYSLWNWLTRRPTQRPHRRRPEVELLERRDVPTTALAHPDFIVLPHASATPFVGPAGNGYSPAQVRHAYGLDQVSFNNGATAADGSGTTIAIVDAYDDPTMASDLHQFDVAFGLPDPVLTRVNQNGGTSLPPGDTGWAQETALDVEWAHAIAPRANILLVEASSASFSDLLAAVRTAAGASGVVAVSMSWGGGEFSGETGYDSSFKTPAGHGGVTFLASSGDSGAPVSYPAASPNVLSVGGTTLSLTSGNTISSESGWSGSGGGISSQESEPSYQRGVVGTSLTTTRRANPDVAYNADPNTGFPVYNSYSFRSSPWQEFGGTSDAAPQWAALVAIADQGRALAGLGALDGPSQLLPRIYSASATDFNDVKAGFSTGSPSYSAGVGYDLVTGRGSPVANRLIPDLVGSSSSSAPAATHFSVTTAATDTAGGAVFVTVTALDASNNVAPGYLGTVQLSVTDPAAVLSGSGTHTFAATDRGAYTFMVTLKTAGSQSISVADTFAGSISGSAGVAVSPAAASALVFGQQPASTTINSVLSPAVTVRVVDPYGNLATNYAGSVSVALPSNPTALGGTTSVTVSGGVATFNTLTVSAAGTGYTLQATATALPAVASNAFTITAASSGGGGSGGLIEGFETTDTWSVSGNNFDTAYLTGAAAHDGSYGLDLTGPDWFYRTDTGATVKAGDTLSAWVQFAGAADGRAYLGFGSSDFGTLSLVAAANTNQLLLQSNNGYTGFSNLAAARASYRPNHWYRLEVDWGTSGTIIGKVFDGSTLLQSVTAHVSGITTGGIALRSIGSDKYWDTITDTPGVNSFNRAVPVAAPTPAASSAAALESALAEYLAARRLAEGLAYGYWW